MDDVVRGAADAGPRNGLSGGMYCGPDYSLVER